MPFSELILTRMSLNEVNWRSVLSDNKSFPPDVEFTVTNKDTSVIQQKFLCHKLLLAAINPVFQSQFFSSGPAGLSGDKLIVVINDCNPAAFQKMLEFIYYQKPYKLNTMRQETGKEGNSLIMDTMHLAVKFRLRKLRSFCEETAHKTVVVNSQNYKEVHKLMVARNELGSIHSDLCEKFKSVVFTRLSRDRHDMDPAKKREIVETELEMFRRGLPSHVMNNKRTNIPSYRSISPMTDHPVVEIVGKSEDVVILQAAPNLLPTNMPTFPNDGRKEYFQNARMCISYSWQVFWSSSISSPNLFLPVRTFVFSCV